MDKITFSYEELQKFTHNWSSLWCDKYDEKNNDIRDKLRHALNLLNIDMSNYFKISIDRYFNGNQCFRLKIMSENSTEVPCYLINLNDKGKIGRICLLKSKLQKDISIELENNCFIKKITIANK